MRRALLLAGNAKRFLDEAREAAETLTKWEVEEIAVIPVGYSGEDEVCSVVTDFVLSGQDTEILLIAYMGHGGPLGWTLDDSELVPYHRLVPILDQSFKQMIILNGACHSGALINIARERGKLSERALIIAGSAADQVADNYTVRKVLSAWGRKRQYRPRMHRIPIVALSLPPIEISCTDEPEDEIPTVGSCYFTEEIVGIRKVPPREIRWGAPLEHYFFPEKRARRS